MIELKEKASNYAEENVINILKDAFARVYADGYRDGYKDCKMKVPFDLHDNKTELVNHDMPIKTKKLKDNFLPTDAFVTSCYEEDQEDSSKHYVGLLLKKFKNNMLYLAAISTPQYKLRLDLRQHYKNNPEVLTNGQYDRKKALELFKQEFPVHTRISLKCKLYDFPILELTDGEYEWLRYYNGAIINIYYHADFSQDRESAKRNCQRYLDEQRIIGALEFKYTLT